MAGSQHTTEFPTSFTINLRLTRTALVTIVADAQARTEQPLTPKTQAVQFTVQNWFISQPVTFTVDPLSGSSLVSYKTHVLFTATSVDPEYTKKTLPMVTVDVVDATLAPVMYRPSSRDINGVVLLEGAANEGGIGGQVTWTQVQVGLNQIGSDPIPSVTVSYAANDQLKPSSLTLSSSTLIGTLSLIPVNDVLHNGARNIPVIITSTSSNALYQLSSSTGVPPLLVHIEDDDQMNVMIIESMDGIDVVTDVDGAVGINAQYYITLTQRITSGGDSLTVTIEPLVTPQYPNQVSTQTSCISATIIISHCIQLG